MRACMGACIYRAYLGGELADVHKRRLELLPRLPAQRVIAGGHGDGCEGGDDM
jgi:hypothetical protein